jgi:hypothetical protein
MLPARFYRFVFSGLMSIWLSTLMISVTSPVIRSRRQAVLGRQFT